MISFQAFSDELQKISAAKWRAVAREGGELAKKLEQAGLKKHVGERFVGSKGVAKEIESMSLPQIDRRVRPEGQYAEAQRMSRQFGAPGAVVRNIQKRKSLGEEVFFPGTFPRYGE
jgi:hypothetical protein